jgi:hypothetical protein
MAAAVVDILVTGVGSLILEHVELEQIVLLAVVQVVAVEDSGSMNIVLEAVAVEQMGLVIQEQVV